ncbi:MAG TPA: NCS2 family permease [Blastocatellia bacterium]|jgi:AGZA family xanthine/uracil permease-like MFS transporter|nr:NCS2 family permease [Blastocatellia bacterium]
MLTDYFKLAPNGTTVRRELLAGATTFATMAYIVFVQPVVLGAAGMDPGAVFTSTCLITAFATILMALLANYPVAVAPAMGHNFFFAYVVVLTMRVSWQVALGAVFVSGLIFVATASFGFREQLVAAVPESLKSAIAGGIGLLITLIGLEWAGLVRLDANTFVTLGHLDSRPVIVALLGVTATIVLLARKVKGAILIGILVAAAAGVLLGVVSKPGAVVSLPPSIAPTAFKLDVIGALTQNVFAVIFVFFFLDLFDTVGSLIGIAKQAGLMRDGKLPRAGRALLADAIGTVGSALAGNTTMVSYIESASGVAAGGRTGLAALVTAGFFLLALFFSPLVHAISGGFPLQEVINVEGQQVARTFTLYPVTSPALIVVGSLMIKSLRDIDWDDFTEALPAFLTLVLIPLTFSVTDGIAFGFISYALLKLAAGRAREAHWLVYLFAALFVIRYAVPGLH